MFVLFVNYNLFIIYLGLFFKLVYRPLFEKHSSHQVHYHTPPSSPHFGFPPPLKPIHPSVLPDQLCRRGSTGHDSSAVCVYMQMDGS